MTSLAISMRRSAARLLLLLCLAASPLAMAPRAHAQENAPAATSASPERTADYAGKEKEAEEPDAKDEYRLSASTGWVAKKLGISRELAATIFDWLNFLVLAGAIGWAMFKYLPRFFDKRGQSIAKDITDARTATTEAKTRLDAVEHRLARLDDEIVRLRQAAERDLIHEEERFRATLDEERQRIVDNAEEEIAAAGAAARREIKAYAAELAVAHAERHLQLTPEMDAELVRDFAANLGRNGSQN